ncbi:MAG: hypothetical protein GY715_13970 [Planctomycetes bacterium]|nr:hypothetical protein [Planctomycetota bacterium]
MSVATARAKLVANLKDLMDRWERVRTYWDDPVSREFEKEYLAPLDAKVRAGVSAMEHMYELLDRAKRDCG